MFQKKAGLAADLLVCALGLIVLWQWASHHGYLGSGSLDGGPSIGARVKEDRVGLKKGTAYVWLSRNCKYCLQSLPALQSLVKRKPVDSQIVAIFPQSESGAAEFLASEGLNVDAVTNSAATEWKQVATPTLVVCNRNGRVQFVKVGVPDEGDVTGAVKVLSRLAAE